MFSHLGSFWIWVPNVKKTSHEVVRSSVFEIQCNCKQLAPWCKRLDSRLSGSELASRQFMWVSWWTERNLGKLFSGFLPFSLAGISFHHFSTLISFIWFHSISSAPVMVRQAWFAGIIAIHRPSTKVIHPLTRPCAGHELRIFIYWILYPVYHVQWYEKIPWRIPFSFFYIRYGIFLCHCTSSVRGMNSRTNASYSSSSSSSSSYSSSSSSYSSSFSYSSFFLFFFPFCFYSVGHALKIKLPIVEVILYKLPRFGYVSNNN